MAASARASVMPTTLAEWLGVIVGLIATEALVIAAGFYFGQIQGASDQAAKDAAQISQLTKARDDLEAQLQGLRDQERAAKQMPSAPVTTFVIPPTPNKALRSCGVVVRGTLSLCGSALAASAGGVTITLGEIDQQGSVPRAMLRVTDVAGARAPRGYAVGEVVGVRSYSGEERLGVRDVNASPASITLTAPRGWR